MACKKRGKWKLIFLICLAAVMLAAMISGCSTGMSTHEQTPPVAWAPEDETEKTSPLENNYNESAAFQADVTEAINNYKPNPNANIIEIDSKGLFRVSTLNDPETDTLDGYLLHFMGDADHPEWIYVPAEFDKYPILHITSTTASLYIPDGPVINLGEPTTGLVLEGDEQTGKQIGAISGWDVQYKTQPENEYAVLIYKDGNMEYGIKIWPVPKKLEWPRKPIAHVKMGCADKQLIYTFYFNTSSIELSTDLADFAGSLSEDLILDNGK